MILNFPDPNNTTTYEANGISYKYDGEKWVSVQRSVGYVPTAGGEMSGSVTVPERTITALFDLATGPYWTCGAIDIPNPTNVIAGMSGLIRLTEAPISWGDMFTFFGDAPSEPGLVPFYVDGPSRVIIGNLTTEV